MATRKTAAKKAVKKAPAKKTAKVSKAAPKKRTYNRKPKADPVVEAPVPPVEDTMQATDGGDNANYTGDVNEACGDAGRAAVELTAYELYDLRDLPNGAKALFLLEFEGMGYIADSVLLPPSETTILGNLKSVEVVKLNHNNKLIHLAKFDTLTAENGIIVRPTHLHGGCEVFDIAFGLAPAEEVILRGEKYKRVRDNGFEALTVLSGLNKRV